MMPRLPTPLPKKLARSADIRALADAIRAQQIGFDPAHFTVLQTGGGRSVQLRTPTGAGTRQDNFTTPEGTTTEDTDTWDITAQGSNRGVKIPVTVRVVYDDAGDETLYGFYRVLEFDAFGRLVAASAETKYTVDAPDAC